MSFQSWDSRVDDDLALLSETLEEVLRSSGDPADQKYIELKARAEQALHEVKARVSNASDNYYYRAKKAVYRADDYVHEKTVARHWRRRGCRSGAGASALSPLIALILLPAKSGVLLFIFSTPY